MLIEQQIQVSDSYKVDPNFGSTISEGLFVQLSINDTTTEADDYVAIATSADNAIGVAGDNLKTSGPTGEYSAALIVASNGATRYSQNRISDFYNETLASGLITVYHSGGTFLTDQFEADVVDAPLSSALYVSGAGKLTITDGGALRRVATLTAGPNPYASGVVGTTVNGSTSLGIFIKFILNI